MAYSESLLYAGYQNLSLSQIYMSGIFIGASGAMWICPLTLLLQ